LNVALNIHASIDHIIDDNVEDDTIYLVRAIFTKIAGTGTMSSARFYLSTNGKAR